MVGADDHTLRYSPQQFGEGMWCQPYQETENLSLNAALVQKVLDYIEKAGFVYAPCTGICLFLLRALELAV